LIDIRKPAVTDLVNRFGARYDATSERFQAKHALGLDPGLETGSREENASKQRLEPRF